MTETVEQKLARYETVIGLQMEEIDRLRAQVTALTEGADDAHSTLRRLYLDEAQNPNTRVRAAQAALNVEKPRLAPVEAPLELVAEVIEPLADVVARQRARADKMLAEDPQFRGLRNSTYLLKGNNSAGNGSDDDTGS
jgi:uncharacterized coiled-coil protein SlyX